jgi:uncharacterized membrane protein YdbT with pleckstrin-like domain
MSYIQSVLQPGEKIIMVGRLHWILYHRAIWCVALLVVLLDLEHGSWDVDWVIISTTALLGGLALLFAIQAWFIRWSTEIAVTDKRVIYKRGLINRHTIEMNMDKVATVDVDQSVLGRLLNYGTVTVRGTGLSFEPLYRIESPLALRNAITAK